MKRKESRNIKANIMRKKPIRRKNILPKLLRKNRVKKLLNSPLKIMKKSRFSQRKKLLRRKSLKKRNQKRRKNQQSTR